MILLKILFMATILHSTHVWWAGARKMNAPDSRRSSRTSSVRRLQAGKVLGLSQDTSQSMMLERNPEAVQANILRDLVAKQGKWRVRGHQSGLNIVVLNNLQNDLWNSSLASAVLDWNQSGAIALSTRNMTIHDPECGAAPWTMKVCNKNFGDTGWKGANQHFLYEGEIVASVVRLNDWHFNRMTWMEQQYTLCHELGHGLGLQHRDEDFDNEDKNDCMDYTRRHVNNMHPGWLNFVILEEIYVQKVEGDGRRNLRATESKLLIDTQAKMNDEERMLSFLNNHADSFDPNLPLRRNGPEWKILSKTDKAEVHERRLGHGFSVRTNFLLA
ncbi:hypothetical protein ACHAWF_017489 [Thalassiosira exigua]